MRRCSSCEFSSSLVMAAVVLSVDLVVILLLLTPPEQQLSELSLRAEQPCEYSFSSLKSVCCTAIPCTVRLELHTRVNRCDRTLRQRRVVRPVGSAQHRSASSSSTRYLWRGDVDVAFSVTKTDNHCCCLHAVAARWTCIAPCLAW